jgi:hypothetical protein
MTGRSVRLAKDKGSLIMTVKLTVSHLTDPDLQETPRHIVTADPVKAGLFGSRARGQISPVSG